MKIKNPSSSRVEHNQWLTANATCAHRALEQVPHQALSLRALKHKDPWITTLSKSQLCPSAALSEHCHASDPSLLETLCETRLPVPLATSHPLSHTCGRRMSQAGEEQVTNLQPEEGTVSLWCTFHWLHGTVCTCADRHCWWSNARLCQLMADLGRGHCTGNLPPVHETCWAAGKPVRLQVWESHMPLCVSLQSTA